MEGYEAYDIESSVNYCGFIDDTRAASLYNGRVRAMVGASLVRPLL